MGTENAISAEQMNQTAPCSALIAMVEKKIGLDHFDIEMFSEDGARVVRTILRERFYAFEGILHPEAFVLVRTHDVVGKNLHALNNLDVFLEIFGYSVEALIVVGNTGHNDVANPNGLLDFEEIVEESSVVLAWHTDVRLMEFFVYGLHVEEDKIGCGSCTTRSIVPNTACGIKGGMDAFSATELEEGFYKFGLYERFAARASHPTLLDEVFITTHLRHEFFGGVMKLGFATNLPRIGVVTKLATHGAALHKGNEAEPGTIDSAHRLDGVEMTNERHIEVRD